MNSNMKHNDCLNFAAVDAAKGICRITNEFVFIDSKVCKEFERFPRCKNCECFINANEDNVGTCTGLKSQAWSYGELSAICCEGYKGK